MRRADRLFELVRLLRRKKAVTGRHLADELGVSLRTVYRDIADLVASGVPIEGEAGVGYRLGAGFDLPPLMFRMDELEALVLGARMVRGFGDPEISRSAAHAFDRIQKVLPQDLRARIDAVRMYVPGMALPAAMRSHLPELRRAIAERRTVEIAYVREDGETSTRRIRPLGLAFFGKSWLVIGWCELRDGFRSFRLDRVTGLCTTSVAFEPEPGKTLDDYFASIGVEEPGSIDPDGGARRA